MTDAFWEFDSWMTSQIFITSLSVSWKLVGPGAFVLCAWSCKRVAHVLPNRSCIFDVIFVFKSWEKLSVFTSSPQCFPHPSSFRGSLPYRFACFEAHSSCCSRGRVSSKVLSTCSTSSKGQKQSVAVRWFLVSHTNRMYLIEWEGEANCNPSKKNWKKGRNAKDSYNFSLHNFLESSLVLQNVVFLTSGCCDSLLSTHLGMLFKSTFFSILQNGTTRNSSALVFDTNVFKGFRSTGVSHGCTDWESIIGVPAFCQTWFEWHFNTTSTFGDTGADESHLNSCWIGEVPLWRQRHLGRSNDSKRSKEFLSTFWCIYIHFISVNQSASYYTSGDDTGRTEARALVFVVSRALANGGEVLEGEDGWLPWEGKALVCNNAHCMYYVL